MPVVYRLRGDGGSQQSFLCWGIKACAKASASILDQKPSSGQQREMDRTSPGSLPWVQRVRWSTDRTGPFRGGGTVPWPVRPHTVLELMLAQDSQLGWSIPGHTSEGGSPTRNVPATVPPAGFPDGCFWLGCPRLRLQVRDAPGRRHLPSLLPSPDLHLRAQHTMLSWHCSRPTAGRGRRGSNEQLVGSFVLVRGRT